MEIIGLLINIVLIVMFLGLAFSIIKFMINDKGTGGPLG